MNRQGVSSTNILSVGFEPDQSGYGTGTLEIEFNSGAVYQYPRVPQSVYDQLMASSSKGKFFFANIKGRYSGTPV